MADRTERGQSTSELGRKETDRSASAKDQLGRKEIDKGRPPPGPRGVINELGRKEIDQSPQGREQNERGRKEIDKS